ncbi:hypothetical protein [Thalassotalea atypica]|uniref:hypothetical protein n=1 Tax=Thalassotalea atypica TaxID=2054316 RepID=UPI0025748800|nr:hypothetical protein [Thalassotalea atypica]
MSNILSTEAVVEIRRKGITEGQWGALKARQKFNWRVALLGVLAFSYFVLYIAAAEVIALSDLPKWFFHIIGVYSSCCFLILTAGEREYSSLSIIQQNMIDIVWKIGASILFLFVGILFVAFISSVMWKGPLQLYLSNVSGQVGPDWLLSAAINVAFFIVVYQKFISSGMLYDFFKIPQLIGDSWKMSEAQGSLVPLAKMESVLAIAFSIGHIAISSLLSALLFLWV